MGKIDNTLLDAYSTAVFSMSAEDGKSFAKSKGIDLLTYSNGNLEYHTNITE